MEMLNLFFEVPDSDRWLPLDRYPRKLYRKFFRHQQPIAGGYRRSFRDLKIGLDRLGIRYRFNDYRWQHKNPSELACVYGYPHVLEKVLPETPVLFGAGGYSHPMDNPRLLETHNIKRILVKGKWMVEMCRPFWGELVHEWAAPINTDIWKPNPDVNKDIDFLVYDKIRWDYAEMSAHLVEPIVALLRASSFVVEELRYGEYVESKLLRLAERARAMIFLCEHETQGLAYQQVLATDVPIFAWDRGGFWKDPAYFPDRVSFQPVTSVPYWDDRCGCKFGDFSEFQEELGRFWKNVESRCFSPRAFILENLSFAQSVGEYLRHVEACSR